MCIWILKLVIDLFGNVSINKVNMGYEFFFRLSIRKYV